MRFLHKVFASTLCSSVILITACGGGGGSSNGGGGDLDAAIPMPAGEPVTPDGTAGMPTIEVTNASAGTVSDGLVTFGQPFAIGVVPAGQTVTATGPSGAAVELQVDAKATHADDSLRHAVLTADLPSLGDGETIELAFQAASSENSNTNADPVPNRAELLGAGFDATIAIEINGTVYTASANDFLNMASSDDLWLDGNEVREWIVSGDLESTGTGTAHSHLHARFHIRAYSTSRVRVAVIVENNWTFEPAPQNINYDLTVTVDDGSSATTVLGPLNLEHYHHARWRRVFWVGDDQAELELAHDGEYLQDGGMVPEYMDGLTVPDAALDAMLDAFDESNGDPLPPNGEDLMEIGTLQASMPDTGFHPDIGPLPRWTARWLISQDARAKTVMLGNAEQGGSWRMHYRHKDTDLPVSIDDFPCLNVSGWGCSPAPDSPKVCTTDCDATSPQQFDIAHQPANNYVPYMITGDYYLLEELQFWSTYNLLHYDPREVGRDGAKGIMWKDIVRRNAWGLRTLAYTAYITPDLHPLKDYFEQKLANNADWYKGVYVDGTINHVYTNPLGWVGPTHLNPIRDKISPWMDDFFTWSVGHMVTGLGYPAWTEFLQYKVRAPIIRMTEPSTDADGWCWRNSTLAKMFVSDNDDSIDDGFYQSPLEHYRGVAEDDFGGYARWTDSPVADCSGSGGMNFGRPGNPTSQIANMTPAMAVAADSGVERAEASYQRFCGRPETPTDAEWGEDPEWAVVPRSTTCN